MKVNELIEKLKEMPQNLEVIDQDNDYIEEVDVVTYVDIDLVRLW